MKWLSTVAMLTLCAAGVAQADTEYKVVNGDNIRAIAAKMSVPVEEVLKANPKVKDPNRIWPGMTLNIPESSPLAGGAGMPDTSAPVQTGAAPTLPDHTVTRTETTRVGVPDGRLRLTGLTWRGDMDQWEVLIPDCGKETCTATVSIRNEGAVPVTGLKVAYSSLYYLLSVDNDCGVLQPGEQCDVRVSHARGFDGGSPGFVVIQASDAFVRPPDDDTIWFWDTVFWICPAADDPRCAGRAAAGQARTAAKPAKAKAEAAPAVAPAVEVETAPAAEPAAAPDAAAPDAAAPDAAAPEAAPAAAPDAPPAAGE